MTGVALTEQERKNLSDFAWSRRSSLSDVIRAALSEHYQTHSENLEQAQARLKAAEARLEDVRARQASGELISRAEVSSSARSRANKAQVVLSNLSTRLNALTDGKHEAFVTELIQEVLQVFDVSKETASQGRREHD